MRAGVRTRRWRRAAVGRFRGGGLFRALLAAAAAGVTLAAAAACGWRFMEPVRVFQSEEREEGPQAPRFGIRLRLEDGTLWFYREEPEIDTH